jgi:tetratricopeptide (TPR) repeat protein
MRLAEDVLRDWQEALRLAQTGQVEAALDCMDKALAVAPEQAALWADRGGIEQLAGWHEAAEHSLRRALELDARQASAHHNLGLLLQTRGAAAESLRHFESAVAAEPARAAFCASLGGARFALQDYAGAEAAYVAALELDAGAARTRYNLATVLLKRFRFEAAERELRRVTEDDPGFFEAWNNLGNVLNSQGRHEEALAAHVRAIELQPASAEAYANAGFDLRHLEHYDDAEQCYRKAIALQPDHAKAHFNLAVCRLLRGGFEEGFAEYVWREGRTASSVPERGDLAGRRILLLRDQGIGDELFFLRFAPCLKAAGAHVICQASPKLAPLLRRWPVLDAVTTNGVQADVTVRLGDLPAFLRQGLRPGDFPAVPLAALPERRENARRALAALGPPPYVAVTWRAGTSLADQVGRS